jgi:hypothetical protein
VKLGGDVAMARKKRGVTALMMAEILDVRRDDRGLLLDAERLPKRVRPRKFPIPL